MRTSFYGMYAEYHANSSAVDTLVCVPNRFGSGCLDWAAWQVGSRTLWNPAASLDIAAEVQWTQLSKSAFSGGTVTFSPTAAASHTFTIGSTGVFSAIMRVQRNFVP